MEPKIGRPIKSAKLINGTVSDIGYENGNGLGVVAGEIYEPGYSVKTIECLFSLDGASDLTGWIVRQKGARKFLVTDGTVTGTCVLVDKASALGINEMSIKITTVSDGDKYLVKFNETSGIAGDGVRYNLSFDSPSAIPPIGSTDEIAQVASAS